jgi:two-component system sensor histidine kinase SenX3
LTLVALAVGAALRTLPEWAAPWAVIAAVSAGASLTAALIQARSALSQSGAELRAALLERARIEQSLGTDLAMRDTVLGAMSEGVWLFEPDGVLAYANRAARTIVGRRFETADQVSPQSLRESIRAVRSRRGSVLRADPANTVVVILRDITRARNVERLRRDFVANASHELKTPVASILALSGALRTAAGDDPEAESRFLSRLDHEAERLAALVRDLLELSRLEGSVADRGAVRIDRIIEMETERVRWRAEAASLRLQVSAGGGVLVPGSEGDLAHLFQNLLENAVRYTPDGGEITVAVATLEGVAEITVTDTGIGIPSRDLSRIFERFYRADAARSRETGGTGLGLSIVRHIAEAHGGSVRCRSVLGSGSTFTVRLPLLGGTDGPGAGEAQPSGTGSLDLGGPVVVR